MQKVTILQKLCRGVLNRMVYILPDKWFLFLRFRNEVGYWPHLNHPRTFNEKLQWLKLHDIHPEYTQMVDKIEAKKYVASKFGGGKYIIPTLGIWNSVDEIEWDKLPQKFVIKVSSDSGGIVVCKDKQTLDICAAKKVLSYGWGRDCSVRNKEYPYRNITPRIIAEEYKEDESGYELKDYKIFCFNGEPKLLFVATDRQMDSEETKFDFYDLQWNHLPFKNGHPNSKRLLEKPKNFEQMLDIARKLSAGIPHVRIDLYNCNGNIYFGEMTFFHNSGMVPFEPLEWDFKLGGLLKLPKI